MIVRDLFIIQGRPTDSDTSHEEIQSEQTNVQIDIVINNIR